MRTLLIALTLVAAVPLHAAVRFLSPQQGGQVFGPTVIEVETTARSVDRVEFYVDSSLAGVVRVPPYRLAFDFGESTAAHRIAAHVYSDRFRNHEIAEITTAPLGASESIDVDLVEVPFRAYTRRSRLDKGDVVIRENGVEQEVLELLSKRGPTSFAFVIDRSLSMRGGKLQKTLRAVDRALRQLRPDDDASVILFNHRVNAARPLSPRDSVRARFGTIVPSGGTSLRDALASIQPARRTVAIVISDGADRNSTLDAQKALQKVTRSKLTIYSLLLGSGGGAEFLELAARRTGGTAVRASADSLERDITKILSDINSRYTAVYQSHGTGKGWREIELAARSSSVQIALARRGYYAE